MYLMLILTLMAARGSSQKVSNLKCYISEGKVDE